MRLTISNSSSSTKIFLENKADGFFISYSMIKDWLDKCDKLEKLNFNAKIKIREGLRRKQKRILSNKSREVKGREQSIV
jgi:hypothetical protein